MEYLVYANQLWNQSDNSWYIRWISVIFYHVEFLRAILSYFYTPLHWPASKIEVTRHTVSRVDARKIWRNQSTTGPVTFISAFWYHSHRVSKKRYEEGPPRGCSASPPTLKTPLPEWRRAHNACTVRRESTILAWRLV